jgi:hypothetical protein
MIFIRLSQFVKYRILNSWIYKGPTKKLPSTPPHRPPNLPKTLIINEQAPPWRCFLISWSGWRVRGTDPLTLFFILLCNIRFAFSGNHGKARNHHPPLRTTPQITPQKINQKRRRNNLVWSKPLIANSSGAGTRHQRGFQQGFQGFYQNRFSPIPNRPGKGLPRQRPTGDALLL